MSHLLLTADGELSRRDGDVDWPAAVGPEGHARVSLMPSLALAAYVNDCGHAFPDRYPRNIVGSCLLAALGAAQHPYAGTIVFVGWNAANTARGLIEIVPLQDALADAVTDVHSDVRRALAGDAPRELSPSWGEQMREIAEHARTAPAPALTVRTVARP
ncbi:hypothetical protein [Streptomyces sp. STR69]|uniref:hypothetical protein n=1 Tax=Streptomyces sp. STR69 TaxID=1796942 RepID=UPI0021CAC326|nr:hypothetical protein [Streptomyces sp. STR69]